MKSTTESTRDFILGQMCDNLVAQTLNAIKPGSRSPFPKYIYNSLTTQLINTALTIQHNVITANEMRICDVRKQRIHEAMEECVYLNHLIRICHEQKWLSEKQRDNLIQLTHNIKYKSKNWLKTTFKN